MSQITIERPSTSAPSVRQPKSRKIAVSSVAEFFCWLLIGLMLVDFSMSIAGVCDQEILDLDRSTGWTLMPGRHYTNRNEGFSRNSINSFGMIDREYTLQKPAGTFRVAVIGCSITMGDQVKQELTYCKLLEQKLNSLGDGRHYEVMNFAVMAYNLGQEFLRMKTLALKFDPDLVVFTTRPNALLYMGPDPRMRLFNARPSFAINSSGELVEDRSYQNYWLNTSEGKRFQQTRWLRYHSRLWSLVGRCITQVETYVKDVSARFKHRRRFSQRFSGGGVRRNGTSSMLSTPAEKDIYERTLFNAMDHLGRVASVIFKEANAECQSRDCRFLLLHLCASKSKRFDRESDILRNAAEKLHVDFLDTNKQMDILEMAEKPNREKGSRYYFTDHLNAEGNKCIADQIFDYLKLHKDLLKKTK